MPNIDNQEWDIRRIVKMVEAAELALPEFQRGREWDDQKDAALLATAFHGWPAGALLIAVAGAEPLFRMRNFDDGPAVSDGPVKHVVLDGQQRITALYHAFADRGSTIFFLDAKRIEELDDVIAGEAGEGTIQYAARAKFGRLYRTAQAEADAGILRVRAVLDDETWQRWYDRLAEGEKPRYLALRQTLSESLRDFELPAIILSEGLEPAALAEIFERLNTLGMALNTEDLMTARLFRAGFHLKDEWKEAKRQNPILEQMHVDALEIIRLVALRETQLGRSRRVQGIRRGDVLAVDPVAAAAAWPSCVEAYVAALHFLKDRCGVVCAGLLSPDTMLLPLADVLISYPEPRHGDLERWFWASMFLEKYARGVNTQAVADAKRLRAWLHDPTAKPDAVLAAEQGAFDQLALTEDRAAHGKLALAIACMLIAEGATDWETGRPLRDQSEIDVHHCFPQKFMQAQRQEPDLIFNLTPMTPRTNKILGNQSPKEVAQRKDLHLEHLALHAIDDRAFCGGHYQDFQRTRIERLSQMIARKLGA